MKRLGGYFKMNVIRIILSVILAIDCLGLIVLVLMQQSKATGLSGSIAGGAETFFGKKKAASYEGKLELLTENYRRGVHGAVPGAAHPAALCRLKTTKTHYKAVDFLLRSVFFLEKWFFRPQLCYT